jgi:tRNA nucleotidyltransferase (CCA-adding enzyme)
MAADLDLSWRLDAEAGRAFLAERGVGAGGTDHALARGTLGVSLGGTRVEITAFRAGGDTAAARIAQDAAHREMTIGAVYWRLVDDTIPDPMGGVADWEAGLIRACGSAEERIGEHEIRAVRYLRRAAALGFRVDPGTRRAIRRTAAATAAAVMPEALAEEIRRVLLGCPSPGAFFVLAHEEGLLAPLLPELAPLSDGRPAGRLEHHPEISQALHMVLSLRTAARLAERDGMADAPRLALLLAVLCHDLGKGVTPLPELPSHFGHDVRGAKLVDPLFKRLPGLGDARVRRLCRAASRTHLVLDKLRELRPGTVVDLWQDELQRCRDDLPLLVRVVRCDDEGRLQRADIGLPPRAGEPAGDLDAFEASLLRDLEALDACLRAVSGEEAARLYPGEPDRIRATLHEARCRALRRWTTGQ